MFQKVTVHVTTYILQLKNGENELKLARIWLRIDGKEARGFEMDESLYSYRSAGFLVTRKVPRPSYVSAELMPGDHQQYGLYRLLCSGHVVY